MYGTTFGALASGEPGKKCPKSCGTMYGFDSSGQLELGVPFLAEKDGAFPSGEPLLVGEKLFGTTEYGPREACGGLGCGTVFRIDPATGKEGKSFLFCLGHNCGDGSFPQGTLTADASNNIYGATAFGGVGSGNLCGSSNGGCGTIFEITGDTREVRYSFCVQPNCADGAVPNGQLVVDSEFNLYGTTQFGGANSEGTIFKLAPNGTLTVLYSFCAHLKKGICTDGAVPLAGLIMDANGNLFGTAKVGGEKICKIPTGCGVVFKLTSGGQYSVLHTFGDRTDGHDGAYPEASVTVDNSGNLYGTTLRGGNGDCPSVPAGCGTVYELSADGDYIVLHDFQPTRGKKAPGDGDKPEGKLWWNESDGFLYGAAREGGDPDCQCGTLYKLDSSGTASKSSLRPQISRLGWSRSKDSLRRADSFEGN
jgi:uncharacterized repeat protein (TIGR03803 family)